MGHSENEPFYAPYYKLGHNPLRIKFFLQFSQTNSWKSGPTRMECKVREWQVSLFKVSILASFGKLNCLHKSSKWYLGIYLNGVKEKETGLGQLNAIVVLCQFLASFTTSMEIHFPFLVFHIKPDCI